jgi:phage terminase large subunit-like protein
MRGGQRRHPATGDPDRDAWIEPFLAEVCMFPAGAHDDQVDAFADAINELALGSTYSLDNL